MKLKNTFILAAFSSMLLFSCTKNEGSQAGKFDGIPVTFGSELGTRASGDVWGTGDAIGIYMKTAGSALSAGSVKAENKKHTTPGNGKFSFASPTDAIYFPGDGSNVDFIAYYPYQSTITDFKYPVNVGGNQKDRLPALDLMYSNNLTNKNKTTSDVTLGFYHELAMIELYITDQSGKNLDGTIVTISGMKTQTSFSLIDGTFTDVAGSEGDIIASISANNTQATAQAIILPVASITGAKITFNIPSHGKTYTWDIPANQEYKGRNKYTYDVEVRSDGFIVFNPESNITDWRDNPGGTIQVGEDNDWGAGTQSDPYVVSQLIGRVGETGKWVTGYIVGSTTKTKAFGASTDNILIAATPTETDENNCIPVDISSSAVKANLDIVANASLIGKAVKIQGDIVDNIFGNTLSMTDIVAQEGGVDPTPPAP